MISQFIPGVIRTLVPFAVGFVASFLLSAGLELPDEALDGMASFLTFVIGGGYYVLALWLQEKFPDNKIISYLLGSPSKPVYKENIER